MTGETRGWWLNGEWKFTLVVFVLFLSLPVGVGFAIYSGHTAWLILAVVGFALFMS